MSITFRTPIYAARFTFAEPVSETLLADREILSTIADYVLAPERTVIVVDGLLSGKELTKVGQLWHFDDSRHDPMSNRQLMFCSSTVVGVQL